MQRLSALSLAVACFALGASSIAACGGVVETVPGGGGGEGSSSGTTGSSSGGWGSSSGTTGSSSGVSSSGVTPPPSPECTGLPVPSIALVCPDGSGAGAYYVWNGSQCVIAFQCPPDPPPSSSSGVGSSGVGGSSTSSSGGYLEPPPPVCDFALPDICEACSNGETVCAHYAIQNGTCVVEICPPSSVPPVGGDCSQGAECEPGTGCGTASTGVGCSTDCTCDGTGHYACTQSCVNVDPPPPPPPPNTCSQGQACEPGSGCGGGPDAYGCFVSCSCLYTSGTFDCSYECGGAADAGVEEAGVVWGM